MDDDEEKSAVDMVDDFEFNYCPECGDPVRACWTFAGGGYIRICNGCSKKFHVMRES